MIDLSHLAGLSIGVDPESGMMTFGPDVDVEETGVRRIGDRLDVLAYPEAAADRGDEIVYHLYRGVRRTDDADLFDANRLRYDITVTLPGDIGTEQFKTAGHIHNNAPDGVGYPEIYEVLHGNAAFVLQWTDPLRLVIIECTPGDRILIPPGASHLTVNHGTVPLVVSDLVSIDSINDYGDFRTKHGAAIYLTVDPAAPDSRRQLINRIYGETPMWRTIQGSRVGGFVPDGNPLYTRFVAAPHEFAYLRGAAQFNDEMQALWIETRPDS